MRLTGDLIVRAAALAAVLVVAVAVAVTLLGGPGGGYTVKADFQNAAQLVKGNLVQTGGAPVGKVTNIDLTPDGQARVTMKIKDDYAPLRRGTLATVRQASLSGVANRYIDLRMAPAERPRRSPTAASSARTPRPPRSTSTRSSTPSTPRRARRSRASSRARPISSRARARQFNEGIAYLNPSLAASSRLFRELNRDTPLLERFIVSSSQLVTDIADRHDDLAGLVDHLATTTTAIGNQQPGAGRRRSAACPTFDAPRQHDLRQPARRARRPRPARRRLQAGREEAAPVPRRAAPARPRRAADDQRPRRRSSAAPAPTTT